MKYVQIMEFQTSHIGEIDELAAKWRTATEGRRTTVRDVKALDRDRPDTYVLIVEFDSYEDAMKNNDLPETGEFAAQLKNLTDGPATFRNLDVVEVLEG